MASDVIDAEFALRGCSDSVLTLRRPNGFFLHLHQFLR